MDKSAGLIQLLKPKTDAKFSRSQMDASLAIFERRIEFIDSLLSPDIIGHFNAFVPASLNVTLMEMHS